MGRRKNYGIYYITQALTQTLNKEFFYRVLMLDVKTFPFRFFIYFILAANKK